MRERHAEEKLSESSSIWPRWSWSCGWSTPIAASRSAVGQVGGVFIVLFVLSVLTEVDCVSRAISPGSLAIAGVKLDLKTWRCVGTLAFLSFLCCMSSTSFSWVAFLRSGCRLQEPHRQRSGRRLSCPLCRLRQLCAFLLLLHNLVTLRCDSEPL